MKSTKNYYQIERNQTQKFFSQNCYSKTGEIEYSLLSLLQSYQNFSSIELRKCIICTWSRTFQFFVESFTWFLIKDKRFLCLMFWQQLLSCWRNQCFIGHWTQNWRLLLLYFLRTWVMNFETNERLIFWNKCFTIFGDIFIFI